MAKKRSPIDRLRDELAGLPRLPGLTFEGGLRALSVTVRDGNALVQPIAALWVDAPSGVVRAVEMVEQRGTPAEQIDQALHALVSACARPIGANSTSPQPNGRIVDLAEAREKRQAPPQVVPEARARAGLPARIVVADRALASAVRALCEPLGIKVEQATRTATFESAITAL
ncbi:MAG TPA: hypothetical protein VGN32_15805, partial [Ktedonobacterales bacterium]|nr:hypothetical protein [Ktedonobacterales bacterium]